MKRHVTFNGQESRCQKNSPGQIRCPRINVPRSAGCHYKNQISDGVQDTIRPCETKGNTQDGTASLNLRQTPHVKTVHIPRSMMTATFLQHPDLTMGQKRYLCSIANIYSASHTGRPNNSALQSQIRSTKRKKKTGRAPDHTEEAVNELVNTLSMEDEKGPFGKTPMEFKL
ncbi:protein FAM216A [Ascaphus truei]|uniref:protein FAM216A n=1 Tax=Ascaphus truei TaxID=8439 RepID=UPI003F591B1E